MTYKFETKATKEFAAKVAKQAEKEAINIMPTSFPLDYEIESKELFNELVRSYQVNLTIDVVKGFNFTMAGNIFDLIAPKLRRETFLLASYIRLNILYNSNFIEITEKDYMGYTGLSRDKFYDAINDAINNKIISKTTRKSIYIVNHNMIFKGRIKDFITAYKIKYSDGCKVDNKGKIILNY